jgi:hypothetical protein
MSESKHARWKVDVASSMHGAALLVPTGEALHVGVTSSDEACAVLWSGYVPYRATP